MRTGTYRQWGVLGTQKVGPTRVAGLPPVVAIEASSDAGWAIDRAGKLWTWSVSATVAMAPHSVSGLAPLSSIDASAQGVIALGVDGRVYTNESQIQGDRSRFEEVPGLGGVTEIAAGVYPQFLAFADGLSTNVFEETASATVAAGGTLTTDTENDGATASDRTETRVLTPTGGGVSIKESPNGVGPTGYSILSSFVEIAAPQATAANPLRITFRIASQGLPAGLTPADVAVFRNGALVPACVAGSGASPDPCREPPTSASGNFIFTVRTSRASVWVLGVRTPTANPGGPYTAVEGATVRLDGRSSRGSGTLSFEWTAVDGLQSPNSSTPTFPAVDDGIYPVTLKVKDKTGFTNEATTSVRVTNKAPGVAALGIVKNERRQVATGTLFADAGHRRHPHGKTRMGRWQPIHRERQRT